MRSFHSLKAGTGALALTAVIIILALNLNGCSETNTEPDAPYANTPPALPDSEQLKFDFSFFDQANKLEKSDGQHAHFVNAYLRTVVLDAIARLVLAAPVDVFSNAINTTPVVEADGTWLWTYDWDLHNQRVHVYLRGLPVDDSVQWELSLSPADDSYEVLWFSGNTSENGNQGRWVFHDLNQDDRPVSGEILWSSSSNGNYLEFVSLEEDSYGNRLTFHDNDPNFSIEFTLGTGGELGYIRWNAAGEGSMLVDDYNDGEEACWDVFQVNTQCVQ
ncbi:MAG: hypothetical protein GY780_15285 [bacterium]|nr:hypothetical protein [bacterium]